MLFLSVVLLLALGASTPGAHFNFDSAVATGKDLLFRGPLADGTRAGLEASALEGGPAPGAGAGADAPAGKKRAKGKKSKGKGGGGGRKGAKGKGKRKKKKAPADLGEYKLTRELVNRYAKDNFVTVSFGNLHYMGFIENWVRHLEELNVTNYIVGAMDDDALRALVERDINAFSMSHSFPRSDFGWGSQTFYKMARRKIKLIQEFLNMEFDVMVSDVDTVWMQDPMTFFREHPDLDILTSSDGLRTSSPDGVALEDANERREAYNIGILYVIPTLAHPPLPPLSLSPSLALSVNEVRNPGRVRERRPNYGK